MKTSTCACTVGALVLLGFTSMVPLANAGAPSTCDDISRDVRAAVSKDPSKVLMILEDALVINETCACEIVKAAITASNADDASVKQIVQTALAVAPKMSAVITECAAAAAPGSGNSIASVSSGKDKTSFTNTGSEKNPIGSMLASGSKNPSSSIIAPEASEGSDFSDSWATNIRGVYLIQPAAAGFITQTDTGDESKSDKKTKTKQNDDQDDDVNDNDDTANRANSRRTRNLVALSPAQAHP